MNRGFSPAQTAALVLLVGVLLYATTPRHMDMDAVRGRAAMTQLCDGLRDARAYAVLKKTATTVRFDVDHNEWRVYAGGPEMLPEGRKAAVNPSTGRPMEGTIYGPNYIGVRLLGVENAKPRNNLVSFNASGEVRDAEGSPLSSDAVVVMHAGSAGTLETRVSASGLVTCGFLMEKSE